MLQSRIYTDLNLDFIPNPITGDISKNVGDLAVIKSVENLVRTNFYERPFNPDVGSNVLLLLFENITPTTSQIIQKEITSVITNYETTRVKVDTVVVSPNYDGDGYNITMTFFINNSTQPVTVQTFLKRIR